MTASEMSPEQSPGGEAVDARTGSQEVLMQEHQTRLRSYSLFTASKVAELQETLKRAFLYPQSIMEGKEYARCGTESLVEQIYEERVKEGTTDVFDTAASKLLEELTHKFQEGRMREADKTVARMLVAFLTFTKPRSVYATLINLINNYKSNDNKYWLARLFTILQDYEGPIDGTEPAHGKQSIEFWKGHLHTFDNAPKHNRVLWSGMLRIDVDEAFELLPQLAKNVEAAESICDLFRWVAKKYVPSIIDFSQRLEKLELPSDVRAIFDKNMNQMIDDEIEGLRREKQKVTLPNGTIVHVSVDELKLLRRFRSNEPVNYHEIINGKNDEYEYAQSIRSLQNSRVVEMTDDRTTKVKTLRLLIPFASIDGIGK